MPDAGQRLIEWYRSHARDLPWRGRRDPYEIWVSEVFLQQTTAAAVIPRYARFLQRFPDAPSLAAAGEAEVLGEVQGLGYYRRFSAMQKAARELIREHDGRLPADERALRALPGVGAYMAAALKSIAFNEPAVAIDGNVERVAARLFESTARAGTAAGRKAIESLLLPLIPAGCAAEFTQALFDLGATVCVPQAPKCGNCPLESQCAARQNGSIARYPAPKARAEVLAVLVRVLRLEKDGALLLRRRDDAGGRMKGFWELPEVWIRKGKDADDATILLGASIAADGVELGAARAEARHTITHHRLRCVLHDAVPRGEWPVEGESLRYLREAAVLSGELPVSTITTKLLRADGRRGKGRGSSPTRSTPRR